MSRNLPAGILSAIGQASLKPFQAVDLMFDSGALYLWNGLGTLERNGNSYIGSGAILSISEVQETSDVSATGTTLTLSGIPSDLLALSLTEPYQNRRCTIWLGEHDTTDMAIMQRGYMNQMPFEEGAEHSTITLTIESRLIALERLIIRRFTDADQQSRFPGDKGCEFVNNLDDVQWGGQ